jgi:hypothetical protein
MLRVVSATRVQAQPGGCSSVRSQTAITSPSPMLYSSRSADVSVANPKIVWPAIGQWSG